MTDSGKSPITKPDATTQKFIKTQNAQQKNTQKKGVPNGNCQEPQGNAKGTRTAELKDKHASNIRWPMFQRSKDYLVLFFQLETSHLLIIKVDWFSFKGIKSTIHIFILLNTNQNLLLLSHVDSGHLIQILYKHMKVKNKIWEDWNQAVKALLTT